MAKISNRDIALLIERFEKAILERESHENNPKKANVLFHEIHGIFKTLRDLGELARLEPLLTHKSISVKNFSAQYFLLVDENKALKALSELAELDGIDGFAAQNLIDRWKKGELHFDY